MLALYIPVFLRLPDDAGYLLPLVPFALLVLATLAAPRSLAICCTLLILSSFALKVRMVDKIGEAPPERLGVAISRGLRLELPGPILAEHARRRAQERYADAVLAAQRKLPPGSALFAADWYPILAYKDLRPGIFQFPTRTQLDSLGAGRVYYLPDTQRDIEYRTGLVLSEDGGVVLQVPPTTKR